jgi:hypothetical protein
LPLPSFPWQVAQFAFHVALASAAAIPVELRIVASDRKISPFT